MVDRRDPIKATQAANSTDMNSNYSSRLTPSMVSIKILRRPRSNATIALNMQKCVLENKDARIATFARSLMPKVPCKARSVDIKLK